ncbi:hypothetical protein MKP05_20250 [Halomonas sp. EGI 63088]|uniref:Uncharacterized protein n=1 Tax=Halomonas flagellata TaxID=2920385 RepID=A0ABS9S006_9GAMM|nr:hypothetical protein [Halomonas flagellata]MCH4565435.1 hypothetical protein [Halomonas flagellata]
MTKVMHLFFIYTFAIVYPFINVVINTDIWPENIQFIDQIIRHGAVLIVAMSGIVHHRLYLSESPRLRQIIIVALLISLSLLCVEILKSMVVGVVNYMRIYSSLGVFLLVAFGAAISHPTVSKKFFSMLMLSFGVSLFVVSIVALGDGSELSTSVYGRERYLFGYSHPGRLAQHLFIVALVLLFVADVRKSVKIFFIIVISVLVIMTSTRLVELMLAFLIFFKILQKIRFGLFLYMCMAIIMVAFAGVALFTVDDKVVYYATSGRVSWWLTSISLNVSDFTPIEYILGSFGELVANLEHVAGDYGNRVTMFRIDNGYIEVFYLHGLFGLIVVLSYLFILMGASSLKLNDRFALVAVFAFFSFSESGLFTIGSAMSLILVSLIIRKAYLGIRCINRSPLPTG